MKRKVGRVRQVCLLPSKARLVHRPHAIPTHKTLNTTKSNRTRLPFPFQTPLPPFSPIHFTHAYIFNLFQCLHHLLFTYNFKLYNISVHNKNLEEGDRGKKPIHYSLNSHHDNHLLPKPSSSHVKPIFQSFSNPRKATFIVSFNVYIHLLFFLHVLQFNVYTFVVG